MRTAAVLVATVLGLAVALIAPSGFGEIPGVRAGVEDRLPDRPRSRTGVPARRPAVQRVDDVFPACARFRGPIRSPARKTWSHRADHQAAIHRECACARRFATMDGRLPPGC